ncbi:hypothetical protein ACFZAD_15265 [Streptomyces iakyrus]|uniref:hypothetical protein n=1 Tax=Streptomyces iakyrus TaxID=68219 RepID=UPI0036EEE419
MDQDVHRLTEHPVEAGEQVALHVIHERIGRHGRIQRHEPVREHQPVDRCTTERWRLQQCGDMSSQEAEASRDDILMRFPLGGCGSR